jgi:hypothetical protein
VIDEAIRNRRVDRTRLEAQTQRPPVTAFLHATEPAGFIHPRLPLGVDESHGQIPWERDVFLRVLSGWPSVQKKPSAQPYLIGFNVVTPSLSMTAKSLYESSPGPMRYNYE